MPYPHGTVFFSISEIGALDPEKPEIGNVNNKTGWESCRELKVYFTNARSLRNKFDELESCAITYNYDIIFICESWINEKMFGDFRREYELNDYEMHLYQRENKKGGGVIMYIRKNLKVKSANNLKVRSEVESLWLDIEVTKKVQVRVGLMYKPPDISSELYEYFLNEISDAVTNHGIGNPILVLGDLNCPGIDWENLHGSNVHEEKLIECVQNNFLEQTINFPTRGENCLDLVFTNFTELISEIKRDVPLASSDHDSVTFSLKCDLESKPNTATRWNYRKGDYDKLRLLLSEIDWTDKFENRGCADMWEIFKCELERVQKDCIPVSKIRSSKNQKKAWLTNEVVIAINEKKLAYKNFLQDKTEANLNIVKLRNIACKKIIRKNRRLDDINVARDSKNSRRFFGHYNKNAKLKRNISLIKYKNKVVEGNQNIANEFSEFFASVFNRNMEVNGDSKMNFRTIDDA